MNTQGAGAERGRSGTTGKVLVFSGVFLFCLGASAQAALAVPNVNLTPTRVGSGVVFGVGATALSRLARRRLRQLRSVGR